MKKSSALTSVTLFIISCLLISGCQPIVRKMYGIKNPRVENKKTILNKALKFGLDTSAIVTVNSKDFNSVFKGLAIPDAAVYDKNGKYIEYRRTDTSCNAGLFEFIPALNLNTRYNQPEALSLNELLKKFNDLNGHPLNETEPADFYLIIYWTIWTGRLNKDHVKEWQNLARANKNCNIKVIEVNLDLQQYWDDADRNEIIKSFGKK